MKARKRRDFKKLDELTMNVQESACVREEDAQSHTQREKHSGRGGEAYGMRDPETVSVKHSVERG